MAAVVSKEPITCAWARCAPLRLVLDRALGVGRVIEQVHVQIAIAVVIEEERLRRVSDVLEPVLFGAIGESAVAVVDVEDVASVLAQVVDAGNVDVDLPVAVDIRHGDARLPAYRIRQARPLGDVLELVVAFVSIEPVRTEVGGEVEIGKAVAIDVADGDAGAIVVVEVVEDVEVGLLGKNVGEADAGLFWFKQLEELGLAWLRGSLASESRQR